MRNLAYADEASSNLIRRQEVMAYKVREFDTYRDRLKGVQILISRTQAGTGRKVKQEQEEISRNQAF